MNEQDLTQLLERAAARAPIKALALDEITSEGQSLPPRRRPILLLGVVAATTLTVLGLVVAQQTFGGGALDDAPLTSPPISPPERPVVPAGTRLVGMGQVVVAVPKNWATEIGGCYDLPLQNRVFFPSGENPSCAGKRPPDTSSAQFYDSRSSSVTGLVSKAVVPDEVNGVSVLRAPKRSAGDAGVVEGAMVVPSEHLLIWVDSPDAEVVTDILNSVMSLPEGYVAIPSAEGSWEATREAMVRVGLEVSVTRTDAFINGTRAGDIIHTAPALGSVVEEGSSVTVVIAGMTKADWTG